MAARAKPASTYQGMTPDVKRDSVFSLFDPKDLKEVRCVNKEANSITQEILQSNYDTLLAKKRELEQLLTQDPTGSFRFIREQYPIIQGREQSSKKVIDQLSRIDEDIKFVKGHINDQFFPKRSFTDIFDEEDDVGFGRFSHATKWRPSREL